MSACRGRSATWPRRAWSPRPSSSSSSGAWPGRTPASARRRDDDRGRRGPHRRGQPEEPEARARRPRPRGLRDPGGRERGGRPRARAGSPPRRRPDGRPVARHGRRASARAPPRRPGDRRHPRDRAHRVRDEGRPGALPRPRLRPLPREAARHPRAAAAGCPGARAGGRDPAMTDPKALLVVDDLPQNVRLLEAILAPRGYRVVAAHSGAEALDRLAAEPIDLVLLDILMPGMDGYEVCRALRAEAATSFLPVVMITASGEQEKVAAIEAGAGDFIAKPFDQAEMLARVQSLLRIKDYHDTIEAQAAELAAWNRELEQRVQEQVDALERLGPLRRLLSPQLAELVVSSGDDSFLQSHRREIPVVFCDLRGFTSFAETVEPEDVMAVLDEYHAALGDLVHRFEGTLERFTGDGLMVIFNDPIDCPDAPDRAVRMALAMRGRVAELAEGWARKGYDLDFGVGIAQGHATLGRIGFAGRADYTAIGSVTNLAARLCAEAQGRQILISQRVHAAIQDVVVADSVGELALRGFSRPARAYNVVGLDEARARL